MAKRHNITIDQGATFTRVFQLLDQAGVARNITGYTAKMDIKSTVNGTAVVSLSSPSGGITVNGGAGQITVVIDAATTGALIDTFTGVYDLKITSGATSERVVEGTVGVSPQVTV